MGTVRPAAASARPRSTIANNSDWVSWVGSVSSIREGYAFRDGYGSDIRGATDVVAATFDVERLGDG